MTVNEKQTKENAGKKRPKQYAGSGRKERRAKAVTVRKWVLIAIVFFCILGPAWYLNRIFAYVPALFLAILLVFSWGFLKVLGRKITIVSDYRDTVCERGRQASGGILVKNDSRLFCPLAEGDLYISDLFGGTDSTSRITFSVPPREESSFAFDTDMTHIGVYSIGMKGMRISDFFGIFHRDAGTEGSCQVYVLPKIRDLEELNISRSAAAESSRETRVKTFNGYDYIGVREYEPGDSMKQIHWKLSAHSAEYMTRIYESNRRRDFLVLLDFAAEQQADQEELMDINDCLIETSLSLIDEISRQHADHSLAYVNRDLEIRRVQVQGHEDDMELIRDFAVIHPDPGPDFPDAAEILKQEQLFTNRSSHVLVCTSRITDDLIQELLQICSQQRTPELYYIIPACLNSRDVRIQQKSLARLDEAGIRYCMVSTEENQKAHSVKRSGAVKEDSLQKGA